MWTNEEDGTRGGNAYRDHHMDDLKSHIIRAEITAKPSLSLDVLCGLPRAMASTKLSEI